MIPLVLLFLNKISYETKRSHIINRLRLRMRTAWEPILSIVLILLRVDGQEICFNHYR